MMHTGSWMRRYGIVHFEQIFSVASIFNTNSNIFKTIPIYPIFWYIIPLWISTDLLLSTNLHIEVSFKSKLIE